ncbi:hypothetical protein MTP99_006009 [Tenebrio molitor]|nr:hypothetical protein MTP99_006009 [Tenebrio molitor]
MDINHWTLLQNVPNNIFYTDHDCHMYHRRKRNGQLYWCRHEHDERSEECPKGIRSSAFSSKEPYAVGSLIRSRRLVLEVLVDSTHDITPAPTASLTSLTPLSEHP